MERGKRLLIVKKFYLTLSLLNGITIHELIIVE